MALLHRAADWSVRSGRALFAATVDHRLRPEAAEEARFVGETCARLGVPHEILEWRAPEPSQAKARRARHALLAAAVRAAGGGVIFTGHNADDDAELFLMRVRRGSTWRGLAGMGAASVSPVWPEGRGVFIARPLLTERRDALRGFLRSRGADWAEDPSNENPDYERARWREGLARAPEIADRILSLVSDFKRVRRLQARRMARSIAAQVEANKDGSFYLYPGGVSSADAAPVLDLLIQIAAGAETGPDRARLDVLALDLLAGGPPAGRTLGGARIFKAGARYRRPGLILIGRDPGLMRNKAPAERSLVWDDRFIAEPGAPQITPEGPNNRFTTPQEGGWRALGPSRLNDTIRGLAAY